MTVDRREPKKDREYSEDEEGKLLREFDIAVSDSAVTRAEIEQIVEALRKERERIRQERRDVLNKEIQDARSRQAELEAELREGQERIRAEVAEGIEKITLEAREGLEKIDLEGQEGQERIALEEQEGQEENAREAEATKNQLTAELEEAKREIEANIQRKKDNIGKKISEVNEASEEVNVHKQALTLYKDSSSKVYTAAKAELEKCTRKAELAQTRIRRLIREIAHLEQDFGQVNGLLEKLNTSRVVDEVSRQEDEMWEAYRAEQEAERVRQEENKESEMDEAIKHKQAIEEGIKLREDIEANDAVRAGYADGLNPEEPIESGTYEIPVEPAEPTKPSSTQATIKNKSQESAKSQKTTGPEQKQQPKPSPKPEKWKVESVAFTVEGGIQPIYRVIVSNGKEQKEVTSTEIAILDTEFDSNEITILTERKGISKAENCYDKGLATILEKIDGEYGTKSLQEYQTLLADREMIHRYPERYENRMKINYDFSGLLVKPNEEMKKLQKMAKANQTKGVISEFKGIPNFLARLVKRIFSPSLPEKASIKMPRVQTSEKALDELGAQMKANSQELTELRIMKDWSDMHDEPGFDIEEFIKQNFEEAEWTSEEANRYRVLQDEYEEGFERDPQAEFRKRIQEEAEKGTSPVKRSDAETKGDDTIVIDPTDITILDRDGNEIGR